MKLNFLKLKMFFKKYGVLVFFFVLSFYVLSLSFYGHVGNFSGLLASEDSTTLIFSITGEGSGKIAATNNEDVFCEDEACFFSLPRGLQLNLKAYPDFTSTFDDWRVPQNCIGQEDCNVTLDSNYFSVWARFDIYPVEPGDEDCAEIGGRCVDMDITTPYGPCEVNEQPGRIAWDLCRFDSSLCGEEESNINLCRSAGSGMYRCCVPIDEEEDAACIEEGGQCVWLGTADPKGDGDPCVVGGEEGRISTGLCNSDPYNYYSCCVVPFELTLEASQTSILLGESSTLTWESEGTSNCEASEGWQGEKPLSGNEVVSPQVTTTYALTCFSKLGEREITREVTINVSEAVEEEEEELTLEFFATPETITWGESSTLTWESQGADSCEASEGWFGERALRGSERVSPRETTTYRLTCRNENAEITESVTVTVEEEEEEDPVTSDRGCEEIGGTCMWVSDQWWDLGAETCDTDCLLDGLCRSEEQDYRDDRRYVCCAPEHFCEAEDDEGPVSEESGRDDDSWYTDTGFGNNFPCPFMLADEKEACYQWCLEGPYDYNDQTLEELHSYRVQDGDDDTVSKYAHTQGTNSVVISHCHTNGFMSPGLGRVVSVYQIGQDDGETDIQGGIVEFISEGFAYRIEPAFPVGGSLRVVDIDGDLRIDGTVDKEVPILKISYGGDHQDSVHRKRVDTPCNEYGLYVEIFDENWGDAQVCADCHFTNDYRCNFYSTVEDIPLDPDAPRENCGRCHRFDDEPPECLDRVKDGVLVEERPCSPALPYWHGDWFKFLEPIKRRECGPPNTPCENDMCIKPNAGNYCCWREWDMCEEEICDDYQCWCERQLSCTPQVPLCPGEPCWITDRMSGAIGEQVDEVVVPAEKRYRPGIDDEEGPPTTDPEPEEDLESIGAGCCVNHGDKTNWYEEGTVRYGSYLANKGLRLAVTTLAPHNHPERSYKCESGGLATVGYPLNSPELWCSPYRFDSRQYFWRRQP